MRQNRSSSPLLLAAAALLGALGLALLFADLPVKAAIGQPPLTVNVITPVAGLVTGYVGLLANTDPEVPGLAYIIDSKGVYPTVIISGKSDDGHRQWYGVSDLNSVSYPNGTQLTVTAQALDASGNNLGEPSTGIIVTVDNPLDVQIPGLNIGDTVSGRITLSASTHAKAKDLTFVVTPSGTQSPNFVASGDPTQTAWNTSWDTTALDDGTEVDISAWATGTDQKTGNSPTIRVTVMNIAVSMAELVDGSKVSGSVFLKATTSKAVQGVSFTTVIGSSTKTIEGKTADPTKNTEWVSTTSWDTTALAPGTTVEIYAHAVGLPPNSPQINSRHIKVVVQSAATYAVKVTNPPDGGTASGTVSLAAETSREVDGLSFVLTPRSAATTTTTEKTTTGTTTTTTEKTTTGTTTTSSAIEANTRSNVISKNVSETTTAPGSIIVVATSTDKKNWTAEWTIDQPEGTVIAVIARAVLADAITDSSRVSFAVKTAATSIVRVTNPTEGSSITGKVGLVADTSQEVDSLTFNLYKKDSTGGISALTSVAAASSDKKNWVADWTPDQPDGTVIVVTARATKAAVNSDSREIALVVRSASALEIKMISPASGGTVSGSISLRAAASQAVDSLSFFVTPSGQSTMTFPASSGDKLGWTSSSPWDTTKMGNGTAVEIYAQATGTDAKTINSPIVKVTVQAGPSLGVTVINPPDGSSASGKIALVATTSQEVDSLTFELGKKDATGNIVLFTSVMAASSDKKKWVADWTPEQPDGTVINFFARAVLTSAKTDSRNVSFTVKAAAAPQFTVVVASPRDTSAVPPGNVPLTAVTSQAVDDLNFTVLQSGQVIATVQAATTDKKLWKAGWSTSLPDGAIVSIRAQARLGTAAVDSLPNTVLIKKDAELPLTVVITMPATGSKLSQVAMLSATTSRKADSLVFKISGAAIADKPIALSAQPDSAGIMWTASWDSYTIPNGSYRLLAAAMSGKVVAESPAVDFSLANQTQTEPPAATVTVVIEAPKTGVRLTGRAMLAAIASQKVDVLNFYMTPRLTSASTGATPLIIRAGSDANGTKWVAEWDTTRSANALYDVVAKVTLGGQRVGESAATQVSVDNQATTQPTTGEQPTTQPTTGEQPTTQPTTGEQPTTQPTTGQLYVKMVGPGGMVRGNVVLNAAVSGRTTGIIFAVAPASGDKKIGLPAVFSRESNTWRALWVTTGFPDGKYDVRAVAGAPDGAQVNSQPVYLEVANAAAGTGTQPAIVVIPTDVVKEAVKALPPGTTQLATDQVRPITEPPAGETNKECQAARIPPDRCPEWLARRHQSDECRKMGIMTKEECVAYLQKRSGGQIPECAGLSTEACNDVLAQRTAGLMGSADLARLNDAVTPFIGQIVRFVREGVAAQPSEQPTGQPAAQPSEQPATETAPPSQLEQILTDNIPLSGEQEVALRVQASPEYAQTGDEDTSHRVVPAVLMIDSDGDGLPDDVEARFGTDPKNSDTDGDGYSDGQEVRVGYNPLGPGKLDESGFRLAPVDTAIISGSPMEQPRSAGQTSEALTVDAAETFGTEEGAGPTQLSGRAPAGETVTIFIYSYLPLVMTASTDTNGNWTYKLDSNLSDGEHEAYVVVTDETGKIKEKSSPLSFFIAGAKAVTESDYFKPLPPITTEIVEAPMNRMIYWYIGGAVTLIVAALVIGALLFFRPKKRVDWS